MKHPSETELALLAGGDTGFARALLLKHHIRNCQDCAAEVELYAAMRAEAADAMTPHLDWNRLAVEMRANIRLGLEAGECVREPVVVHKSWNPKLAVALASLVALIGSGVLLTTRQHRTEAPDPAAILRSTADGIEVRSGSNSFELLNRTASFADQTVGAEGQIGARYVDDTGAVTINNVYLGQ